MTDKDDIIGQDAIIASIEKQWAKTDHNVFIAAIVLNPFYWTAPFGRQLEFNNANLITLFICLWKHFHNTKDQPPMNFSRQALDYLMIESSEGMFALLPTLCQIELQQAKEESIVIACKAHNTNYWQLFKLLERIA